MITDWVIGGSDTRYYGRPGRPYRWLDSRYKMTVRIDEAPGGTRVAVYLYEETNYPRSVTYHSGLSRMPWSGYPPYGVYGVYPGFEWEYMHFTEVDNWVHSPSSTLKEHALLNRIEALLGGRGAGRRVHRRGR